jgi:uncharacterized protein (DUF58 family)
MYNKNNDNQGDGIVFTSLKSLLALQAKAKILSLGKGKIRAKNMGQHLSVFKGRGMDFAESRPYQAGDDVRSLDWRVTARTGKPHTKLYQEERERPVLIWIDMRNTMFFATKGAFKSVVAAELAALLAWKSKQDGDRIGGMLLHHQQHIEVQPSRSKYGMVRFLNHIAECSQIFPVEITQQQVTQKIVVADEWRRLRRVVATGSRVFILSDFRSVDTAALQQLLAIQKQAEVTLIPISDPLEQQLPQTDSLRLSARQQFFSINLKNLSWKKAYQQRAKNRLEHLKSFTRKYRMGWISMSTEDSSNSRLRKLIGALR